MVTIIRMMMSSKSKKTRGNVFFIVIFSIIVVLMISIVVMTLMKENDSRPAAGNENGNGTGSTDKWQEGVISYNGKKYLYNTSIKTYLFLGIDKAGKVTEAENGLSGGQSDAIFLLVENGKAKTMSIIAINRNTMTGVDVYDEQGGYEGQYKMQICLQHGYGDGMRISCLRSVDAVSRLFFNLPISGYMSMNMDAIPIINDAVGGVTVQVMNDLESTSLGVSLKQGENVTLSGNEAYVYIRSRDVNVFDSASMRLERQKQYISGFLEKAGSLAKQDERFAMRLYDSISDYLVTSIDFAALVEKAMKYDVDFSNIYTVPGETVMGEQYEEYHVDDDALYEMILDIFYDPVEE